MLKVVNQLALLLVVLGALNWGLVGLFEWNLVEKLLSSFPAVIRAVYVLIGVAGVWVGANQVSEDLLK